MTKVIGTCSVCGGPVTIPTVWHGTNPPIARCSSCGATPAEGHGPIIPMKIGERYGVSRTAYRLMMADAYLSDDIKKCLYMKKKGT